MDSVLRLVIDSSDARKAERDFDKLADQTDRAADQMTRLERTSRGIGNGLAQVGRSVSGLAANVATAAGALAGLASGAAGVGSIRLGADLERQIAVVGAVSRASADELVRLEEAARAAGASTEFTATQAAEGLEFLARAGFSANEAIGALPGVLQLATANALDLGKSADIASNVLSGFNLQVEELGRVNDVLTAAAANANTNVEQLGEALKFAAPAATAFGLSVEETVAAVGKLSDAGIQGGLAGRGLQSFVGQLAQNRDDIAAIVGDFDIAADGLDSVLRRISGLSTDQALSFFGAQNLDIFSVLTNAATQGQLEDLTDTLQEAEGAAARVASQLADTLVGDVRTLNSAWQEFLLTVSEQGQLESAREIIQDITNIFRTELAQDFAEGLGRAINFILDRIQEVTRGLRDVFRQSDRTSFLVSGINLDSADSISSGLTRLAERASFIRDTTGPGGEFEGSARLENELLEIQEAVGPLIDRLNELSGVSGNAGRNLKNAGDGAEELARSSRTAARDLSENLANLAADVDFSGFLERQANQIVSQRLSRNPETATIDDIEQSILRSFQEILRNRGGDPAEQAQAIETLNQVLREFPDRARAAVEEGAERGTRSGQSNGFDFRQTVEGVTQVADQLRFGIATFQEAIENQNGNTLTQIEGLTRGIGQTLDGITSAFGDALGGLGATLGSLGDALQAVGAVIGVFNQIFGSRSSGATFDPNTGEGVFVRSSVVDARNDARDSIAQSAISAAQQIAEIVGGQFIDDVGLRVFIDAQNRILLSLRDLVTDAIIALPEGTDGSTGITDRPSEAIAQGLALLFGPQGFEGGSEALLEYVQAAFQANRATDDVVEGVTALRDVFALIDEPLSTVEQRLKSIDDAVNPVIEDLEELGLSIEAIGEVAAQAVRAVGIDFIRDIEQDILDFRNRTLGDFKRILDEQERLLADAQTLLERGAITPAEFDLVQVRNSLQREQFFSGLSPEELESLGDFFGLIEDSGGSVAVILTQLQTAFVRFVEQVAETREELEEQARQLQRAADQIFATRDNILLRFPRQSGGELLGELRGQLANLREQAFAGDNTAFEQIPALAERFVNLARDIFGSTEQFAQERDFALNILDQTGQLAEARANKLLSEIEALNMQVEVLNDIRDILESPDPAIELIQRLLNEGAVQSDLLRQLLTQYIALTQEARANQLTPGEAQAVTEAFFNVGGQTPNTIAIDRFDESIVILAQVREAIRQAGVAQVDVLNSILTEQRRSGVRGALTG